MEPDAAALHAIRSWYRLQRATAAVGRDIRSRHGVTGEQLAILRIVAERDTWALAELRGRLIMHPATLGQAIDRLAARRLVTVDMDAADRRRRVVAITDPGRALLGAIAPVGPVRLRSADVDPSRLERLSSAFEDAIELFGLQEWAS